MLPGSKESGVPLTSKVRVPPLWVEGLTTLETPALNAAAPLVGVEVLLLPLLLLLHALAARAAAAPNATAANMLRLFMPTNASCC